MTRQPAATARGAYSRETAAPAENSAMSHWAKSNFSSSLHRHVAAAEADAAAERALARQREQRRDREVALLEHADHRLADEPGGADDGDTKLPVHGMFLYALRAFSAGA